MEEWLPAKYDKYKSSPAIDVGNRLFDTKDSVEQDVPIGVDIDPKGLIAAMARKSNVRHTVDNAVLYLSKQTTGGKAKYTPILPQTIVVGDIVEVKFCVIAVPARFVKDKGHSGGSGPSTSGHRIKLKLCAVVRIDTEFSDNKSCAVWNSKMDKKRALSEPEEDGRTAVMRRSGYEDDE
ncbi:hypothetical protein CYLTODRAFT_460653 [Cylindrobasidium torrendii FP15055 ss-10]|uniref:Uncharacterized protein n=1 Tax=Cylindrobasidium torrendii FP15055 ss-10 TaxID=1314674 RepID=A0A0D7ATF7_9AGAR|nr:hypothetical protein CYLTODRAFT_460653 [Cylindrobasidium torrendii FP15055 ss-10]